MNIRIGDSVKNIPNVTNVHMSADALDIVHMYGYVFDEYPVFRCSMVIRRDNENDEIEQVIYDDLVKSGQFSVMRCEYEYGDNDTGNTCIDKYYLVSNTDPLAIACEFGNFEIMSHLGMDVVKGYIDKYLKPYDQGDKKDVKCYIMVKEHDIYLKDFPVVLKGDLDFDLYNDGFEDVHKEIVKSIREDHNGLYLLYGNPGTGKTTYIRHLIKECGTEKTKFVYVPSNLFGDFTNPNLLTFLMDNRGCVFIIEDCESLVTVENGIRSAELTDLLNMTDGLLADALDIKIICTFNIDDGKIDNALLRPGRCKCRYEFNLLDKDKANRAADKLGLEKVDTDTSLADLFNTGKNFSDKKKKIGFN